MGKNRVYKENNMRILYYTWYENSQKDMSESLSRLGHEVICCHIPFSNYERDDQFTELLEKTFIEYNCDCFLSFDFFPLIAKSADYLKKIYISCVYDTPHLTVFSPSVQSNYVKLFVFDKILYERVKEKKSIGLFHMPLAVNVQRLDELLNSANNEYVDEISFVGSLYENNIYRKILYIPEYIRGYLEGIIFAQQKIYGYNFVEEVIPENINLELQKYIKLELDESYGVSTNYLYANMINAEITARDREDLLEAAADIGKVTLYSASKFGGSKKIEEKGIIDYQNGMSKVFRNSKINLNITLRSITSGIPLRALDIMGAGGFLLSNYQPELAEYFVDGEDMVLFDSVQDMCRKLNYYLKHEEERKKIARNGYEKIKKKFSYDVQIRKIVQLAIGDK